MTQETRSGLISRRRVFSLISAALGVVVPATILAVSEAEAQTAGMERRQDRRGDRQDRRENRREDREARTHQQLDGLLVQESIERFHDTLQPNHWRQNRTAGLARTPVHLQSLSNKSFIE